MIENDKELIAGWRVWADRCESQGRPVQAALIRNLMWETENGAPWLEMMRQQGIQPPEVRCDA